MLLMLGKGMKKRVLLYIVLAMSVVQGFSQVNPGQALIELQDELRAMGAYRIEVGVQTVYKNGQLSPAMTSTLTVQGDMFVLDSPIQSVQYDGQTLYTLDKKNKEVNIETMAKSSNPLMNPSLLLQCSDADFQKKESGEKLILVSKTQGIPFKTMIMTFSGRNLQEIELGALTYDNQIKNVIFNLGQPTKAIGIDKNTFTFNKKAHPAVDVVDFRKR